jgi:hypothetical protein
MRAHNQLYHVSAEYLHLDLTTYQLVEKEGQKKQNCMVRAKA